MASVSFPQSVGGDGSTVTDDANPNTGLRRGGYQTRFVPALTNTVNIANNAKGSAESALASKTAAATSATEAKTSELAAADFANAAQQTTLGFSTNRPTIRASLNLDFVNQQVVDRRIVVNRNSPKTYFGKEKVLGDENLLRYSEDFANAVWTKVNSVATANNQIAPNGELTAETLTANAVTSTSRVSAASTNTPSVSIGKEYVTSVYLKYVNHKYLQIVYAVSGATQLFVNVDIELGQIVRDDFSIGSIETANNGYYRVTLKFTAPVSTFVLSTGFIQTPQTASLVNETFNGTEQFVIWGAQLETAREGQTKPTAYVRTDAYPVRTFFNKLQTASANTMPVEFDPITQECLGIKPESQQTNLLTYSNDFSNSSWVTVAGVKPTLSQVGVNVDGSVTAWLATPAGGLSRIVKQNLSLVANTTYVFSAFVKKHTDSTVQFATTQTVATNTVFNFDTLAITGSNGTYTSHIRTVVPVGNGWFRLQWSFTIDGVNRTEAIGFVFDNKPVTSQTLIANAQFEQSTLGVPSSYIPTTTAQVTRLADDLSMPVSAFEYNQNEGTLYAEVNTPVAVDSGLLHGILSLRGNLGLIDRVFVFINSSGSADKAVRVDVENNDIIQANVSSLNNAVLPNTVHRVCVTFKDNEVNLYFDGTFIGSDTLASIPTNIGLLEIFGYDVFAQKLHLNGFGRCARYYPKALSALEAQSLSQV